MKKIFLTGASSGIGLAIAKSLTGHGYEVWGTSRIPSRIPPLTNLHPVRLDLSEPTLIEEAFKTALLEAGHFDVVINNAGSGHFGPAQNLAQADVTIQFQILFFGPLQLLQLALEQMESQDEGLIINVSSLASRLPVPFMAAYNSAKAALAAFIMSMQLELRASEVHLVDLQPADIYTEFNNVLIKGNCDPRYEAAVKKTWEAVDRNMKGAPKPDLVAKHILRLIRATTPPPRITVGDLFQSKIAPFIFRFLPQRVRIWGLKRYYGI
jgi:short-subunit dehydrogenase